MAAKAMQTRAKLAGAMIAREILAKAMLQSETLVRAMLVRAMLVRAMLVRAMLASARFTRAWLVSARLARQKLVSTKQGSCAKVLEAGTHLALGEGRRLLSILKSDILFVVYRFNDMERAVMKVRIEKNKRNSDIEGVLLISRHLLGSAAGENLDLVAGGAEHRAP